MLRRDPVQLGTVLEGPCWCWRWSGGVSGDRNRILISLLYQHIMQCWKYKSVEYVLSERCGPGSSTQKIRRGIFFNAVYYFQGRITRRGFLDLKSIEFRVAQH